MIGFYEEKTNTDPTSTSSNHPKSQKFPMLDNLVGGFNPSEKY